MNNQPHRHVYIAPDIELFEIRADERITIASCQIPLDKGTSKIQINSLKDDYLLANGIALQGISVS